MVVVNRGRGRTARCVRLGSPARCCCRHEHDRPRRHPRRGLGRADRHGGRGEGRAEVRRPGGYELIGAREPHAGNATRAPAGDHHDQDGAYGLAVRAAHRADDRHAPPARCEVEPDEPRAMGVRILDDSQGRGAPSRGLLRRRPATASAVRLPRCGGPRRGAWSPRRGCGPRRRGGARRGLAARADARRAV